MTLHFIINILLFSVSVLAFIKSLRRTAGFKLRKLWSEISIVCISILLLSSIFLRIGIVTAEQLGTIAVESCETEVIYPLQGDGSKNSYVKISMEGDHAYYCYMTKDEENGYITNTIAAENVTIYNEKENYRVEKHKSIKKWLYFEAEEYYLKIYIPEEE